MRSVVEVFAPYLLKSAPDFSDDKKLMEVVRVYLEELKSRALKGALDI